MSDCCHQNKKIVEVTSCIFAAAWTYEDGTKGCGLQGSDRDCHWCYKYLEQKTRRKEEGCNYGRMVGYAKHPSLPRELCSVWEMLYPDGSFAWWDVGVEMYKSLREAIQHGWEMKFDWQKEEKEPVSRLGCTQYNCRANSEYGLCYPDPKSATCCIETTAPELLDQHAESCGFIRVSDRWTMWKYGVPYKELKCRNCNYYDGELHGICRLESKGRFSGCKACEKFKRKEGEEVAKKAYWTKCGRKFEKNSTAVVTGYELNLNIGMHGPNPAKDELHDPECRECPFPIEITQGWGENKKHVRWECRAGSKPPNHTTEWVGSLKNKNSIQIHSLDHELLEEIRRYCDEHPDLSAGYNADYLADCRKTLSISCSPNKRGIAAKKALIEKFFPETEAVPDERYEDEEQAYSNFPGGYCDIEDCPFNDREDTCCFFDEDPDSDGYNQDVIKAVDAYGCKNRKVLSTYDDIVNNEGLFDEQRCRVCGCTDSNGCPGGCYWVEDDLCSRCAEDAQTAEDVHAENTALEAPVSNSVQAFDYSTVDQETAEFLQEKAQRITEIRLKSVIAIGKELKEAHDRLANNKTGTFEAWVESLGITHKTSRNYINAYEYMLKNFQHIEDAEKIQPSLLFAISKPSAPKELQQAVLNGDIKTHKEYKELEAKLKAEEDRRKAAEAELEEETKLRQKAERQAENAENQRRSLEEQNRRLLNERNELEKQLKAAKESGDSEQIETLKQALKALDEEVTKLRNERDDLQRQVKERPIEAQAVKTVEVIPETVKYSIVNKITTALDCIQSISNDELNIYVEEITDPDDALDLIQNSIKRLENVMTAINEGR